VILLERVLSERGQCFVTTAVAALKKPNDQYVVISLLEAIANYFYIIRPDEFSSGDIEKITFEMNSMVENPIGDIQDILHTLPEMEPQIQSMLVLSCLSVKLVDPVFSQTDAIGSGMRKKIKPVTETILFHLNHLLDRN